MNYQNRSDKEITKGGQIAALIGIGLAIGLRLICELTNWF